MADQKEGIVNFLKPKRTWVMHICAIAPTFYYFNKHRSVLMASKYINKTASYYAPSKQSLLGHGSQNRVHHIKELLARYTMGLVFGFCI